MAGRSRHGSKCQRQNAHHLCHERGVVRARAVAPVAGGMPALRSWSETLHVQCSKVGTIDAVLEDGVYRNSPSMMGTATLTMSV